MSSGASARLRSAIAIRYSRGVSIVELMISMTLGLLLMAGLLVMYSSATQSFQALQVSGEHLENGRYASHVLNNELRHAGYFGELAVIPTPGVAAAIPDPCSTVISVNPLLVGNLAPLNVYDSPALSPLACLADTERVANTDILVIRRAGTEKVPQTNAGANLFAQMVEGAYYLQTNAFQSAVLAAYNSTTQASFNLQTKDGTDALIRRYRTDIYFISPCSGASCVTANDGIPTLKRLELDVSGGAPAMKVTPLVEGIENMQIEIGIDNLPAAINPITELWGDGVPDAYLTAPTVSELANAVSAKIFLLARSTQRSSDLDTKTYELGASTTVTPGGNFKRHVFTTVVSLNNPGGRRN